MEQCSPLVIDRILRSERIERDSSSGNEDRLIVTRTFLASRYRTLADLSLQSITETPNDRIEGFQSASNSIDPSLTRRPKKPSLSSTVHRSNVRRTSRYTRQIAKLRDSRGGSQMMLERFREDEGRGSRRAITRYFSRGFSVIDPMGKISTGDRSRS